MKRNKKVKLDPATVGQNLQPDEMPSTNIVVDRATFTQIESMCNKPPKPTKALIRLMRSRKR